MPPRLWIWSRSWLSQPILETSRTFCTITKFLLLSDSKCRIITAILNAAVAQSSIKGSIRPGSDAGWLERIARNVCLNNILPITGAHVPDLCKLWCEHMQLGDSSSRRGCSVVTKRICSSDQSYFAADTVQTRLSLINPDSAISRLRCGFSIAICLSFEIKDRALKSPLLSISSSLKTPYWNLQESNCEIVARVLGSWMFSVNTRCRWRLAKCFRSWKLRRSFPLF